jgi:thiol:disulfide interchange protein
MTWKVMVLVAVVLAAPQEKRFAGYDPSRDPAQDLANVVKQTTQNGKRILLVVGGEWCGWCHTLEAYVKGDPQVQSAWFDYATIKVNYSRENENKSFLSQYPRIPGYPHIFVLDKDGKFLHSQGTAALESGSSYSKEKLLGFLEKWKR